MTTIAENLANIDFDNDRLNVFVERAANISQADILQTDSLQTAEGALSGFGIAVKSNIAVAGMAHTAGIGAFRHRIAGADATVVKRLRDAGACVLGTVNMEEAALGAITNNPHFGRTENPLRAGYTPGGSSGGSAAAVAAGMARVSLGTDTMGSCRIPAAYCGVIGFKPSFGRVSVNGVEPLSRRLDHVGVLARTVADVRIVASVICVFDHDCANARLFQLPAFAQNSAANFANNNQPKRLAVLDDAAINTLSTDVQTAYRNSLNAANAANAATGAGFQLVARSVDIAAMAAARRAGLLICEAELANSLAPILSIEHGVSSFLHDMIAYGAQRSAPQLAACHAILDNAVLMLRKQLADVDAIFWPTAPQTAFPFSAPIPANQADFTCLANFTGAPAISMPATVADGALPVGVQLIGAVGGDDELLSLAAILEPIL